MFNFIVNSIKLFPDIQNKITSSYIKILAAIASNSSALNMVSEQALANAINPIAGNASALQSSDKAALWILLTTFPSIQQMITTWPDMFYAVYGVGFQGGDSAAQAIINASPKPVPTTTPIQLHNPAKKPSHNTDKKRLHVGLQNSTSITKAAPRNPTKAVIKTTESKPQATTKKK